MELPTKQFLPLDFKSTRRTWIKYSRQNTNFFPLGAVTDFEWKDYSPEVFRHIQVSEGVDHGDYMLSICGQETVREVTSLGKGGALFQLSKDDRFVIKILEKSEVKVLLKMLPNYYRHLTKYGASLLAKYYGLHSIRPHGGLKVYFVVMENIFRSNLCIHRRYDLKGASHGRTVGRVGLRHTATFKDLDLDFCFYLNPLLRHRLLGQIKYDSEFLESEGIMGYSFLLGIHIDAPRQGLFNFRSFSTRVIVPDDRLHRFEETNLTLADICQKPESPGFRYGVKMPARAVRIRRDEMGSITSHRRVGVKERYDVLLYFGIIDILKGYSVRKRLEHAYKSFQYDSKLISVINPKAYSARFQDFLCKVFQPDESDLW